MAARIIDGRAVAAALRASVAQTVAGLGFQPGLAVVLVGDDPASAVYVRSKDRAAQQAGITARTIRLPAEATRGHAARPPGRTRRGPGGGRHPRAAPAAPADPHPRGARRARSREGRGRADDTQCRAPRGGPAVARPLHAARRDEAAGSGRVRAPRPAGARARALGAGGTTGRRAADAGRCDGHRRAFPHARPRRRVPARGADRRGGRAGRRWCGATGSRQARR